jgi:hypothetical protein
MPFSIDPQPEENELECARCGAHFFYELTRCPECGVNIYEPDEEKDDEFADRSKQGNGLVSRIRNIFRRVFGKPYSAEEIFGDALNQAMLYDDLLQKVGGDHLVIERLVDFEKQQKPNGTRMVWLQNAIRRWERDNRIERHL